MQGGLKYLPARISAVGHAFDLSPDAFVITSVAGRTSPRILHVNTAFERLCGYSMDELVGRSPRLLQGPDTDAQIVRMVGEAVRQGEGIRAELVNYHKNGTPYRVDLSITPLANREGRVTHFMAVERDVTASLLSVPILTNPGTREQRPATDMTLVIDAQNRVFAASKGFLSTFIWRESDLLGSPSSLIVVEQHSHRMRTSAERRDIRHQVHVRIRTGTGRFQSALADLSPFLVADRPLCQLISIRTVPAEDGAATVPAFAIDDGLTSPDRPKNPGPPSPAPDMPDETGSLAKLTRREAEILALLPAGISNQAIADQLGVAEVTVKLHLRSIYRKIGVTGRPGAIRIWRLAQGRGR